jgi:hypothetical protein
MNKVFLIFLLSFIFSSLILSQETYKIGTTEYYSNESYSTTGKTKVKRSASNKMKFLKSLGYVKVPYGYEIDHIIPLSEGGSDDPSNMQLLTIEQHKRKTAKERSKNSNSTYTRSSSYYSTSTYEKSYNSSSSLTCGALTKSGTYCKRKVKDGGRCHAHQ